MPKQEVFLTPAFYAPYDSWLTFGLSPPSFSTPESSLLAERHLTPWLFGGMVRRVEPLHVPAG
jgi:hypothetical protein